MSDTITITGNIATEPELKRTPSGIPITTFRIASRQRRYDRASGAWTDAGTNWYAVSTFRGLADHAYRSLHKGDRVLLTGRLRLRAWETDTKRGLAVEIDADAIGHDLLWGTSTFVRDPQNVRHADEGRSPEEWAPENAWTTPGVHSSSDLSATPPAPDGEDPVGAAAPGWQDDVLAPEPAGPAMADRPF